MGVRHITQGTRPPALDAVPASHQWQRRPVLSLLVRASVVIVPAVAGIAAGTLLTRVLPQPSGFAAALLSFAMVSLVMLVTIIALERAGRRLLPWPRCSTCHSCSPTRPQAVRVARRVGKPRDLQRQLQEAHDKGVTGGEVAHMQTVLELVAALSVHDRQTRGHSERVRVFSDLIADEMKLARATAPGCAGPRCSTTSASSEVPAEILEAREADQRGDGQRHAAIPSEGARLIGPLAAWLGEWAGAVARPSRALRRHAAIRGGSPATRSRSPAASSPSPTSYEVMTAVRPYSKPIGVSAARQELVKCSGAQFDPVVVRAFLNISVGRLWRVVGIGSWIAQLPVIGWVDRLGWNWGAAIMSGTTAIALTAPGIVPRPAPVPTPTTGISVVSTNGIPGAVGGSTSGPGGPGASTGGSPPAPTTRGKRPRDKRAPDKPPRPRPELDRPGPMAPRIPGAAPAPPRSPSPRRRRNANAGTTELTPIPHAFGNAGSHTDLPDEPPVVTVKGGLALLGNFNGSGTFTDADLAGHTFTATVNYGDGTATTTLKLTGTTFKLKHTYNTLLARLHDHSHDHR